MNVSALSSLPLLQPQSQSVQPAIGPLTKSSIGPEVTVTLSDEAIASAREGGESFANSTGQKDSGATKAPETAPAEKTQATPPVAEETWGTFMEKVLRQLRVALKVPDDKALVLGGAAASIILNFEKEKGLTPPKDANSLFMQADLEKESAESVGIIGFEGCNPGAADLGKGIYAAFDRNTVLTPSTKLGSLSAADKASPLSEALNRILEAKAENGHAVSANDIKWHSLTNGSDGKTSAIILSTGLDASQDDLMSTLAAAFGILRGAAR